MSLRTVFFHSFMFVVFFGTSSVFMFVVWCSCCFCSSTWERFYRSNIAKSTNATMCFALFSVGRSAYAHRVREGATIRQYCNYTQVVRGWSRAHLFTLFFYSRLPRATYFFFFLNFWVRSCYNLRLQQIYISKCVPLFFTLNLLKHCEYSASFLRNWWSSKKK